MFYSVVLLNLVMLFFSSTGVHVGDQTVINNVAGFMIEQLTDKYPRHIGIGNLTSSHLFGGAKFEAFSGNLSDIQTIERSGDVIVSSDNDEMNVTLTFTFTYLKVVYPEFTESVMGLSTCGALEVSVEDNLFSVFARISEDSKCFVTLHKFNVLRLGGFNVNLIPKQYCPLIRNAGSKLITMAVNYFQDTIKQKVEEGIHKALQEHIPPSKFICVKL